MNAIMHAIKRLAAKTISPKFYTLDPKAYALVIPNDIAAELFAHPSNR